MMLSRVVNPERSHKSLLFLTIFVVFITLSNFAYSQVSVSVKLEDSVTPIKGVNVYYSTGTNWIYFGKTDSTGFVTKDLQYNSLSFKATYNYTTIIKEDVDLTESQLVEFNTVKLRAGVFDGLGNGIKGSRIYYQVGTSWRTFGTTDSTGTTEKELFPDTLSFKATYSYTSKIIDDFAFSSTDSIKFETVRLTADVHDPDGYGLKGARVYYQVGTSWRTFGTTDISGIATHEFFPDTMSFKATYSYTSEIIEDVEFLSSGTIDFQTTKMAANVHDVDGSGIKGARIYYQVGTSWRTFGTTDSTGTATHEFFPDTLTLKASYSYTSEILEDAPVVQQAIAEFQTERIEAAVKSSAGAGLKGVRVYYQVGTSWRTFGTTDSTGTTTHEFFPDTMSFKASYSYTTQVIEDVAFNSYESIDFETVTLTSNVNDSEGNGLKGARVYYQVGTSWRTFGTTDSTGTATHEFFPDTISFKATYSYTSEFIDKFVFTASDSLDFQTTKMAANVHDVDGSGIKGARIYYQVGTSWRTFGTTDSTGTATHEFFPDTLNLKTTYSYTSKILEDLPVIQQSIAVFQTERIEAAVKSSAGAGLKGARVYYQVGTSWRTFGTTDSTGTATHEFFPDTMSFKATYSYTSKIQEDVAYSSNESIDFETVRLTANVRDSEGDGLKGARVYYQVGTSWRTFGTTDLTGTTTHEFFPDTLSFKAVYSYTETFIDSINIVSTPDIDFSTAYVTFHADDYQGLPLKNTSIYTRNGDKWRYFGRTNVDGDVNKQLFPSDVNVKASYAYTDSKIDTVTVTDSLRVNFQTTMISAEVKDLSGIGLEGIEVLYGDTLNPRVFGITDEHGTASKEVFGSALDLRAVVNGETISGTLPDGSNDSLITLVPGIPANDPGVLGITPSSINFADVYIDSLVASSFIITNTGGSVLSIDSIHNSTGLTISGAFPFSIEPGDSVVMNLNFTPVVEGGYAGTITVFGTGPEVQAAAVSVTGNGIPVPAVSATITIEDAEDGLTGGWVVYSGGGNTSEHVLVRDSSLTGWGSKVIELAGPNLSVADGFRLEDPDGTLWGYTETDFSWSMNFNSNFTIYIWAETDNGKRYIIYNTSDTDGGYSDSGTPSVTIGLGSDAVDGTWHTYNRDIQADLELYEPGNNIVLVEAFMIRGTGLLDDITIAVPETPVADPGVLGVSPSSIVFPEVYVDSTVSSSFYITNTGGSMVTVDSISIPTVMSLTETFPFTVEPGDSTQVTVFFEPFAEGAFIGTLTAYGSGPNSQTANIDLSGNAVPVPVTPPIITIEDAEDGFADGWVVYSGGGNTSEHVLVRDSSLTGWGSKVIELAGPNLSVADGFRLEDPDGTLWG
ncbi:MAG: choice-of-anchor D domain-containing protein, partial [bacterium]|nr:choice-of-anchor D domain-containing protein [bacterium]